MRYFICQREFETQIMFVYIYLTIKILKVVFTQNEQNKTNNNRKNENNHFIVILNVQQYYFHICIAAKSATVEEGGFLIKIFIDLFLIDNFEKNFFEEKMAHSATPVQFQNALERIIETSLTSDVVVGVNVDDISNYPKYKEFMEMLLEKLKNNLGIFILECRQQSEKGGASYKLIPPDKSKKCKLSELTTSTLNIIPEFKHKVDIYLFQYSCKEIVDLGERKNSIFLCTLSEECLNDDKDLYSKYLNSITPAARCSILRGIIGMNLLNYHFFKLLGF